MMKEKNTCQKESMGNRNINDISTCERSGFKAFKGAQRSFTGKFEITKILAHANI